MKLAKLVFGLALLTGIAAADPSTVLSTWGAWPMCVDGVIQNCSWYTPGSETYILLIHGDTTVASAYKYSVTATLADGSSKVLEGVANRQDNADGWTTVGPITFGGVVKSATVSVDELATVSSGRKPAIMERR